MKNLRGKLGLLLVGTVVGLVLAEIILRLMLTGPDSNQFRIWPPGLVQNFVPANGMMPGISDTANFTVNSIGFRGREIETDDKFKVLALGGSTTECLYLDDDETWPAQLSIRLNKSIGKTWVGNGGRAGYSSRHHVLQAKYLLPQHPEIDLVIFLIGVNDFLHFVEHRERYESEWSENTYLEKTFLQLPLNMYSPWYRRMGLWHVSRLAIRNWNRSKHRDLIQDEAGEIYQRWRQARQNASEYKEQLPNLEQALSDYKKNLEAILTYAEAAGQQVLLVDQPVMWADSMSPELEILLCAGSIGQRVAGNSYYTSKALAKGLASFNTVMSGLAAERKIPFAQLSTNLNRDTTVFYDDVHFNESGAEEVADLIAPAVIKILRKENE